MSMNIRVAQESDKESWDAFVDSHSGSVPYQLFAWGTGVRNAYGFSFHPIMAESNQGICGIFPVIPLKKPLCRPEYISLPYCDIGGVLAHDQETESSLLEYAAEMLGSARDLQICLRSNRELSLLNFPIPMHRIDTDKVRMVLELPESADALWQSFKSKLRSQIKKAVKNGLEFRFPSDGLDDFYAIYTRNMRDLGSPAHSKKWFAEIIGNYGERAKLGIVYNHDLPIGGGLILCTKTTVSIPWASTIREYNNLSPNMLLYWKLLEFAAAEKYSAFDFGRSSVNSGTFKFKAQWGAQPQPLYWYDTKHLQVKQGKTTSPFNKREMAETIWRSFPVWFANIVGARVRKYISL